MRLKTRIIVDSTADLVPEIKERVYTVPLTVHFGQEEYIDGVTIDNKTFYEKLVESDVLPTTSQAPGKGIGLVFIVDYLCTLHRFSFRLLVAPVADGRHCRGSYCLSAFF